MIQLWFLDDQPADHYFEEKFADNIFIYTNRANTIIQFWLSKSNKHKKSINFKVVILEIIGFPYLSVINGFYYDHQLLQILVSF